MLLYMLACCVLVNGTYDAMDGSALHNYAFVIHMLINLQFTVFTYSYPYINHIQ